jgi:hypothetical protein
MKDVRYWMADLNEEALLVDGFEEAFIGFAERCGQPLLAVYDREKCIAVLCGSMTREDAEEYFDFNIAGAWVGEMTPLFLTRYEDDPEA